MIVFEPYLKKQTDPACRARIAEILSWTAERFPNLAPKIAWNQPMFTDHGTYIIGFSSAKAHLSVAPEQKALQKFAREIDESGYCRSKELFRIKWNDPVNYPLLEKIIQYNIVDKADCATFWRPKQQ